MQPARIAELLRPFLGSSIDDQLTATDLESISMYIDVLQRWNARINLTAIRDPEQVVTRHFGESLFAARHLFRSRRHLGTLRSYVETGAEAYPELSRGDRPVERCSAAVSKGAENLAESGSRERAALQDRVSGTESIRASAPILNVVDIGSGAGFPGIPLKLWAPDISLTLIESNQKKAIFLREVARVLTLTDINVRDARAEALNGRTFGLVTLRAVERFEAIVPTAIRLLALGGRLALLIGTTQIAQAQVLGTALRWAAPIPIPQSRSGVLLIAHDSRAR